MPDRSGRRARALGAALLIACLATPASWAGALEGDGIAAWVGGTSPGPGVTVILRSDAVFRALLARARESGAAAPEAPLEPAALARALDELVGEALLAREADRVGVAAATEGDLVRELRRLEAMAGGADALRALADRAGLGEADVAAMARRRARVQSFLVANLEGTGVVSEARARAVYEGGEHPFVDLPFEEALGALRAWIAQRELERALARWVRVLRGRTTTRILAPWRDASTTSGTPRRRPRPTTEPSSSSASGTSTP